MVLLQTLFRAWVGINKWDVAYVEKTAKSGHFNCFVNWPFIIIYNWISSCYGSIRPFLSELVGDWWDVCALGTFIGWIQLHGNNSLYPPWIDIINWLSSLFYPSRTTLYRTQLPMFWTVVYLWSQSRMVVHSWILPFKIGKCPKNEWTYHLIKPLRQTVLHFNIF